MNTKMRNGKCSAAQFGVEASSGSRLVPVPDAPDWFRRSWGYSQARQRSPDSPPEPPVCDADVFGCEDDLGAEQMWFENVKRRKIELSWPTLVGLMGAASVMSLVVATLIAFVAGYLVRPTDSWSFDAAIVQKSPERTLPGRLVSAWNEVRQVVASKAPQSDQPAPQPIPNRDRAREGGLVARVENRVPEPLETDTPVAAQEIPLRKSVHLIPAVAHVEQPLEGFALRPPQGGGEPIDVHIPQNSWFSLANAGECDSGMCRIAPVARTDRRLNTALEWESTPEQAAAKASREGKLVYLIHVSGNFAQPGFT